MRFALALALLAAAPAIAGVPESGEGTITLLGGLRLFPGNGTWTEQTGGTHRLLEPGAIASFGYQFDDELHFKIDLGYGVDKYSNLTVRSVPLLIGLDTVLLRRSWFSLYGGGGVGYSLNTFTRDGQDTLESNATAVYLQLGWRVRLGDNLAFVVEERYTLSSAQTSSGGVSLNVGGNLLSAGLMVHFNQPDDKGHPQGP